MDDETLDNLLGKADSLIEIDRAYEALPLLEEAARLSPDNAEVLCRFSHAHICLRDWNAALNYANMAVIAAPNEEWAHRLCSVALQHLGDPRESLRAAVAAIKLDPENAKCTRSLAQAQIECELYEQAEVSARRAIHLEPDEAHGYAVLAQVFISLKMWKPAEENARKALEIEPENAAALTFLAAAISNDGGNRRAFPYWVRLLQNDPTNASVQKIVLQHFSGFPYLVVPASLILLWIVFGTMRMTGLSAFWLALVVSFVGGMLLFRFWPQSLLYPQPTFWTLPASHRDFVSRTWQKEWLKRSGSVMILTGLMFGLIGTFIIGLIVVVAFPPIGGIWFLTRLFSKHDAEARRQARHSKVVHVLKRFLP